MIKSISPPQVSPLLLSPGSCNPGWLKKHAHHIVFAHTDPMSGVQRLRAAGEVPTDGGN